MKKKFVKHLGPILETLEIDNELRWIYIHYTRGNLEKATYLLKNADLTDYEYLQEFFIEHRVSDEMKTSVKNYLLQQKDERESNIHGFVTFLLHTLSVHVVMGLAVGFSIFAGYKYGTTLDIRLDTSPAFTITGILLGFIVGGLISFAMIVKYLHSNSSTEQDKPKGGGGKMKLFKRKPKKEKKQEALPVLDDVTVDDVRKAIRTFSEDLPKGVYRTILVNDDNSIDFSQLAHILGGIPSENFYMSRETYDLFEEEEKEIPAIIDRVQKAVDLYVKEHKKYPVLSFDPLRRVNYYLLVEEHCLDSPPDIELYITDYDGLITHIKPDKKETTG